MRFLHDFEVFSHLYNTKILVEILTQIAIELKDMLSWMTPNFLREYALVRCYEEIAIELFYPFHTVRIVKPFEESFKDCDIQVIAAYLLVHRID